MPALSQGCAHATHAASYYTNKAKAQARMAQFMTPTARSTTSGAGRTISSIHRAHLFAMVSAIHATHHDQFRHYSRTKRARKAGNGGSHTLAEWRAKCATFNGCCAYCGEARFLTRDHDVPLSRGGTDDISNILPACMPCNRRKHARTAAEFLGQRIA